MNQLIKDILKKNKIRFKKVIKKDSCMNSVYDVDDKYILRINTKSREAFKKSEFLLKTFNDHKIKVPKLIRSGILNKTEYYIYEKLKGNTLSIQWHKLNLKEKEQVIKDLCKELKKIASIKINSEFKKHGFFKANNWKNIIIKRINTVLNNLNKNKTLNNKEYSLVKEFCNKNFKYLTNNKIVLVHNDTHFGNIIIYNKKFQGIIDLDDVYFYPLDFQLTTINKLVKYPKSYTPKKERKFVKNKDYSQIITWFKKYYPELFKFKNSEIRQKLYAIRYDVGSLYHRPTEKGLKKILLDTIQ